MGLGDGTDGWVWGNGDQRWKGWMVIKPWGSVPMAGSGQVRGAVEDRGGLVGGV